MSKARTIRKRRSQFTRPPERASNSMIPWLHGLAAMGDERWDEAIAAFQRFLEMGPRQEDRLTALQNLGACCLALERYDEALAALDEIEQSAPDDPEVLYSWGVTCACAARIPEAIVAFEHFARRWPKLARQRETQETLRKLRCIQRGEVPAGTYLLEHLAEQLGLNVDLDDFHLVERKARRMIMADPERDDGHFALGVACLEQGRYQEALETLLAAHSRDPDYEPTLYNIGYVYIQQGEPGQAIPWLERAVRHEPKHLAALHQLGVACEQLGRRDEAVAWWQRALKIDSKDYPTQQRLHKVGQGPAPVEPPLSPLGQQLRTMAPLVKARMRNPQIRRNGGVTLTYDGGVGVVLEDAENPLNGTVYAGGPFHVGRFANEEDLLDLMGLVKMLLRMINSENTQEVAVLIYYVNRPTFNYQLRFAKGKQTDFQALGQFVVTESPRFFKLRIDSDLSTPYGDPMQGSLIYLDQRPQPGVLINTLGLESKKKAQLNATLT